MPNRSLTLSILIYIFLLVITGISVHLDWQSPLRTIVTTWFLLMGPGFAFVPLLKIKDPIAEGTVIVGLSLALDVIVAVVALYSGQWSPNLILLILILLSFSGAVWQLARVHTIGQSRLTLQ